MYKYLILFILIFTINCESWWSEINGHNYHDNDNGYSGSPPKITNDFYLCSERHYRLHFVGDDNNTWSEEYTACEPAGIDRAINGIAIDGGCSYQVYNDGWSGLVEGYNTSDPNGWLPFFEEGNEKKGFAAKEGRTIMAYIVYGREYYRCSDSHRPQYLTSHEKLVAERLVSIFFNNSNYSFSNYSEEQEIDIPENNRTNATFISKITLLLLKRNKINFNGNLKIKIEKNEIININYNRLISDNYYNILNYILDFDIKKFTKKFENLLVSKGISNGDIIINFNWPESLVVMEIASKIKFNFYGYRGGIRIKFYLNDDDIELISQIKSICKVFIRYSGKIIPEHINKILSSFNSFKHLDEIIRFLDIYSVAAEEVIFYTLLSKIIIIEEEN